LLLSVALASAQGETKDKFSGRTIVAEVVALDQPFMVNRLGSSVPTGQIFALRTDVMPTDDKLPPLPSFDRQQDLSQYVGKVMLKPYKRPRPIVMRVNVGDILEIRFCNLLSGIKPSGRNPEYAGFHIMGMNLLSGPDERPNALPSSPLSSDSSYVGRNVNSFAIQGSIKSYRFFAAAEGTFIISSAAQPNQTLEIANGLFGCAVVEPPQAEYYRSQVTRRDLFYSTYYSSRLPANMLLHREPGTSHWILTTYKTRLRNLALKNVDVVIKKAESELLTVAPPSQEQNQGLFFQLNRETGKYTPLRLTKEQQEQVNNRADMEAGNIVPEGYLYSAPFVTEHGVNEDAHPIIDYSISYDIGGLDETGPVRAGGSPILRMLYPVAKSLLAAQNTDAGLKITKGDTAYQLPADPGESQDKLQERYRAEINELDSGSVPRKLVPVLNAWGVQEIPDLTKVTLERSYLSGATGVTPNLNYIWLLTGVTVNGEQNDSVLIQGDIVDGKPQLILLKTELQLLHSDPTAIITGPQAGRFSYSQNSPSFYEVPALPDRRQPFREFVLGYHNFAFNGITQAFPQENAGPLSSVLNNGNDFLAINYGIAGIASEIMANRLGVGPEGINEDGVDLKFEEFFLSSWAVGDPAMLVDRPANTPPDKGIPGTDPPEKGRATRVCYPDDPSNVYHSYMRDHVTMRIYNAGPGAPHVHHLHAHQWLRSPNSDDSQYLDSELIVPGSAFSLDMVYNGSGNRNQTVGDSIFHCHFYPHFARGMWALWRVHDVFEEGTLLDPKTGAVKASDPLNPDPKLAWVRALPDGEIQTGTPIPAVVPLPALGTAPFPARVRVTGIPEIKDPAGKNPEELEKWVPKISESAGRMVQVRGEYRYERDPEPPHAVKRDENNEPIEQKNDKGELIPFTDVSGKQVIKNPGYPFFIPGIAGHRPPHPALAMAWEEDKPGVPVLKDNEKIYLDGGLPRHQVLGGQIVREFHTRWDFTKDFIRYENDDHLNQRVDNAIDGALVAYLLPEDGTPIEKAAMKAHASRSHETVQPDGSAGNFILNGLPPANGAPYADPGVDDNGNAARDLRKYKAAAIQKDVVFNKLGWHYPQERFITLWQDVKPTFDEKRPPQPFFFRANGGETVEFWHTNLVPDYYQLDDFQVRTPTDIIGQHIHLVKFDVTSSDGAANGFNYEDGVFSPDEVRARIFAITRPWAEGSYKHVPQDNLAARKYDLFAFNGNNVEVASIDWSKWARTEPLDPVPWDKSYMQWQMSQGQPKPDPSAPLPPKKYLEPPSGQNWDGAMTTIMRFSTDPLLNNEGQDRTVRTVFTHDHFGPSTHQQTGLYGGLLVEPTNSTWIDPVTGRPYYDTVNRSDGGPTGWEAIIRMPNRAESYREFALELQDLQLAYGNDSRPQAGPIWDSEQENNPSGNQALFSFEGAFSEGKIMPQKDLYANFLNNGIRLSDSAELASTVPDQQWAVKDKVNYAYGPTGDEAAFYIVKTVAQKYNVVTPHLDTWIDWKNAINAPNLPTPNLPTPSAPGTPQLVSQGSGTYSFNYRSEPLTIASIAAPSKNQGRVAGKEMDAADFAYSFASLKRDEPWNETKPKRSPVTGQVPPPLFNRACDPGDENGPWFNPVGFADGGEGVNDGKVSSYDPYTPLLRAYQNDRVQIRILAGAHVATHSFMAHGIKWLFEPSSTNSGYRNAQGLGLSEHFELNFRLPPATTPHPETDSNSSYSFADYFYAPSSDTSGLSLGLWGVMRSYDPGSVARVPNKPEMPPIASLYRLPEAANPRPFPDSGRSKTSFTYPEIPDVEFIVRAKQSSITYNDGNYNGAGPIQNKDGIVFVVDEVKVKNQALKGVKTDSGEPLIMRVKAGDWIKITLQNEIGATYGQASATVGLHPQLLAYDVTRSDGANIGFNPVQTLKGSSGSTAQPEKKLEYWWYAGELLTDENGNIKVKKDEAGNSLGTPLGQPRELGAINLLPPDPLNQHNNGLVGALVVEPKDSTWTNHEYLGASAAIKDSGGKLLFREFVLIHQNDVNASYLPKGQTSPAPVNFALNNKSEDLGYRLGATASPTPTYNLYSNAMTGGDPKTPVFEATAGERVRFRVVFPGGAPSTRTFEIHGHSWQEEPCVNNSLELGNNVKSQVLGAQIISPNQSLNILIDSAGGRKNIPGDYLFCDYLQTGNKLSGAWGILRVKPLQPAD